MQSLFSIIRVFIVVYVLTGITFIGGCSDNPNSAADKKAQAAVDAAIKEYSATGDFNKAQKVLAGLSADTSGQEIISLVNGSLKCGKANEMQNELVPLWAGAEEYLDKLSDILNQITKMQLEKAEIEMALRSRQEERKQLASAIDGDANGTGLVAKQKDAQTKLSGLKSQHSQLEQKYAEKLKQATELQRQADELLAKAELATGDEKTMLQKQAYDVLLGTGGATGKNAYLSDAQELQDQLNTAESEITLVEPEAATLSAQIENYRKRIDELDKSDFAAKSNERLTAIGSAIAHSQEEFSSILSQVEQAQTQLAEKMKQITDVFLSAQKDFKKVFAAESLGEFAKVAAAETAANEGRIAGDYSLSQQLLAARLSILASVEASDSQAQIKTLAQRYLDNGDEYVKKAMADYNDASNLYAKIPTRKSDEFSIAVLKNRILALAQKAYLAERVKNMDVKAGAIEQAKDLIDKVVKADAAFEASLSRPPYNILTGGKTAAETAGAAEKTPIANAPASATTAKPNQPVTEPNQAVEEPNSMPSEPNSGDANAAAPPR